MTSQPINLTQLRAHAEFRPLTEQRSFHTTIRTEVLLALIDTAEAAREFFDLKPEWLQPDETLADALNRIEGRLRESLAPYTTQ